jgi:proteasome alpha subunit
MPFYVAPEQMMKDRAEYAQKGIARGRALVAVTWADGVLFAGENPSRTLYKTSEIYDRIGFAAVGKYNEFESLRVAGIRLADVKGYQYARQDVAAKSLANAYSQSLGAIFMGGEKPYEVELLIAEVGNDAGLDMFHIRYDGSIGDEHRYVAIGGEADALNEALGERWRPDLDLEGAVRCAVTSLSSVADRDIPAEDLEVSGLDRTRPRRTFFRLEQEQLAGLLGEGDQ